MIKDLFNHPHYSTFLLIVLALTVFGLVGCQSTENVLSGLDYVCVDVTVDGPWTDSGIAGRGIILPEGKELDQGTIDSLCNY